MLVDATIDSRVITPLSICWIKMRRRVTSGMRLVENTRAEEPPQLFIHAKTHAKHPNRDSCDVKAKSIRASFSTQFHITTSCCSYGGYATPSVSHMLLCAPNSKLSYSEKHKRFGQIPLNRRLCCKSGSGKMSLSRTRQVRSNDIRHFQRLMGIRRPSDFPGQSTSPNAFEKHPDRPLHQTPTRHGDCTRMGLISQRTAGP